MRDPFIPPKEFECQEWCETHPGKTRRDWLLEARCPSNKVRKEFRDFLDFCDSYGIEIQIPSRMEWIEDMEVEYDFGIDIHIDFHYDLDAPDELYTGLSGWNEAGWKEFYVWKWQQVLIANKSDEKSHDSVSFYTTDDGMLRAGINGYELEQFDENRRRRLSYRKSQKWNHPDVLAELKRYGEWASSQKESN